MEPLIPDGSYCVFSAPIQGTRQGRVVLAQLHSECDPENGERYTVKRYESSTTSDADGSWKHVTISLHPINRDFDPIVLTADDESAVSIIAEFVHCI
jgi:SOS-response transcriptional repressor LexA